MGSHWLLPLMLALPPPSEDVARYLNGIRTLYQHLEFERALQQIDTARRLSRGPGDDVPLGIYEGLLLAELGRTAEARAQWEAALVMDPDAALPLEVSPKVQALFADARRGARRRVPPVQAQAPPPPSSRPVWVPALAGGAVLIAGAACLGYAWQLDGQLQRGDPSLATYDDVQRTASRERTFASLGAAGVVLGGATVAAAALWGLLGGEGRPTVTAWASPGTAGVLVQGGF